jgi:hypothetical protein
MNGADGGGRILRIPLMCSSSPHTHVQREMQAGTIHVVSDGTKVLDAAKAAANGMDVLLAGCQRRPSSTCAQNFRRIRVTRPSVALGASARLFADLSRGMAGFDVVNLVSSPAAAHYTFGRAPLNQ